jgi:hypothetical protein
MTHASLPSTHASAPRFRPRPRTVLRVARILGAASLLAVGVDHIEQYSVDSYSAIPTIGTLFALNFASAVPVALGLIAPLRRLAGRWAGPVLAVLALSGIGIAAGSLVGLLVSEHGGLFGFMEQGYRFAIVLSIVFEVAAIAWLSVVLWFYDYA